MKSISDTHKKLSTDCRNTLLSVLIFCLIFTFECLNNLRYKGVCNLSEQTIYGQVVQNGAVARAFSEQCIYGYIP